MVGTRSRTEKEWRRGGRNGGPRRGPRFDLRSGAEPAPSPLVCINESSVSSSSRRGVRQCDVRQKKIEDLVIFFRGVREATNIVVRTL